MVVRRKGDQRHSVRVQAVHQGVGEDLFREHARGEMVRKPEVQIELLFFLCKSDCCTLLRHKKVERKNEDDIVNRKLKLQQLNYFLPLL